MREAGVPLVPGTEGATTLGAGARARPARSGSRCCSRRPPAAAAAACASSRRPTSSTTAYATASAEADAAFGDGSLYVEKALVPARHVEIQVLADGKAACSRSASASARSSAATRS